MTKEKRNKFSIEDRQSAVLQVIELGESYGSVARKLQTSERLVSRWVNSYKLHGVNGLSLKNKIQYTGDFKLQMVVEMLEIGLSLSQMSAKHSITISVLSTWRRLYEQHGTSALFEVKPRGKPPKVKKPNLKTEDNLSDYEKLLKENQLLRAENDYLKKLKALIQAQESQTRNSKPKSLKD